MRLHTLVIPTIATVFFGALPSNAAPTQEVWQESELGWTGTWIRTGDSMFRASWWHPTQGTETATIVMLRNDATIRAKRTQPRGACEYLGHLQGRAIQGTFSCSWVQGTFEWTATMPENALALWPKAPAPGNVWVVNEGAWVGRWTKISDVASTDFLWTRSSYGASYIHPNGAREEAQLTMERLGRDIYITRQQGDRGSCTYQGKLSENQRSASGEFWCTWAPARTKWTAVLDPGVPRPTSR